MGFYEYVSITENKVVQFCFIFCRQKLARRLHFVVAFVTDVVQGYREIILLLSCTVEWRIQDFSEVGTSLGPSLDPPMQYILALADLEGVQGVLLLAIFFSFCVLFDKNWPKTWREPFCVRCPSFGKSWIRHCSTCIFHYYIYRGSTFTLHMDIYANCTDLFLYNVYW